MVDYNTRQRKRNMVVGGFVLIAFCIFVWLIFIFGELPVAVSRFRSFRVLVNFTDAPGVQENTPVRYCGYQVGRVIDVSPPFLFDEPRTGRRYHQVKVTLAIDKDFTNIPSNVDVMLMKRGLGSSFIEFQFDPDREIEDYLKDATVKQGSIGSTSDFFPKEMQEKLESLVESIGTLADSANEIVSDEENQQNIKDAIENVRIATAQATTTLKSFEDLSAIASDRVNETADKAGVTLDSIKTFSDTGTAKVDEVAEQLAKAIGQIRQVLAKINEGEGSAAKVLNDGRLYENLLDSSQELQMALEQLKNLAAEAREKGIKIKW
jgi:phospholipid/cholesterol/gamma-HCH transport system substrate-binding protein